MKIERFGSREGLIYSNACRTNFCLTDFIVSRRGARHPRRIASDLPLQQYDAYFSVLLLSIKVANKMKHDASMFQKFHLSLSPV